MTGHDENDRLTRALRRSARLVAGAVAVVGVWFLIEWMRGAGENLVFAPNQVPTAPATALLAVLLGIAIAARAQPDNDPAPASSAVLPLLALGLALWFVVASLLGIDVPLERWLAGPPAVRDGVVLGRISVVTAAIYAVLALAMLLGRGRVAAYEGPIASLAFTASFLILQGYILGAPLLYGSGIIPVAAPTAIILCGLSLAAILISRADHWPMRLVVPPAQLGRLPSALNFVWLAVLFSGAVVSSGYFWYSNQRVQAERQAVATLQTVANLKSSEISIWNADIASTVQALATAPFDPAALRATATSGPTRAEDGVLQWLEHLRATHGLEAVALFGTDGRELRRASAPDARPVELLRRQFAALRGDTAQQTGVFMYAGAVRLTHWAPLHAGPRTSARPSAWLALVVPVDRQLYPRLLDFPGDFRTGDYSLWQFTADSALLLSAPRDADLRPLSMSIRLDSAMRRDVFEPLASPDGFEGPGFGGQQIRAVMRDIPGTDWRLVVKVDRDELRAPILSAALRATALSLLFLLGGTGIAYALWYRRDLARTRRELALIEDREHGLQEIEASEQRYARVMRGTSDGLWDMNMVSGEVYASPRWREIAAVPPEVPVTTQAQMLAFLHPDDVAMQQAALAAHLADGTPYDIELRLRPQPGQATRWVRTRAEVERDPDGRPIWMSGAITDVTRRRSAEEDLQRTARLLRVRTAVNQAIVRAEDEDALLQMICEILVHDGGYRMSWIGWRDDDPERSVRPLAIAGDERGYLTENPVSWGDGPRGQGPTGRCIRTGQPQVAQQLLSEAHFEPWREAARERGYESAVAIPLTEGAQIFGALMIYAGEPDAFDAAELDLLTALGLDVSFGIAAFHNLESLRVQREQLTLFRQAIDRSADAIFVADVQTGKFVDFNAACLQQLGYTAEELSLLGPGDIVADLDARGGLETVANGVRAAGGGLRPSLHMRKDGSEVPVEVALSVLDLGPRSLVLGIARDISDRLAADADRESLQQMLNRAQKMESVGRLAGGVAHDFNNLLTVINATAELAMNDAPPDSSLTRDLKEIRAAGDRAAKLTRQLLAFSRQQVLKREVLNLNVVVSGFLTLLNRVIGEDIHVEVRLGTDVPNVIADANQLEQVLMNLCVNARDAMPRGGTLTIGTGAADIDEGHAAAREGLAAGRYATLSVTDTGVGMDEGTQAKIFEPFFTTKETGRGTGLGLATVYGIVKQTGGSIYVFSEIGRGTMFLIYLPITAADVETPMTDKPEGPSAGKETILLVEDEESIRLVAKRVLTRAGYAVLEAESGIAALDVFERKGADVDLVLTDLVMPGMGGIELAAELRKRNPRLKFLFASGYSADAVSEQFVHDGEWNFIGKPYGLRELTTEVRRVLDS